MLQQPDVSRVADPGTEHHQIQNRGHSAEGPRHVGWFLDEQRENQIFALLVEKPANVTWTFRGVAAILYLVVFGSWIGYTAYIWLLQHVPTSKVSTYAYVNPVVAVFLGWLVLHERIDRYILMGSAIIVASVVLVTSAKVSSRSAVDELPAVEAAGD